MFTLFFLVNSFDVSYADNVGLMQVGIVVFLLTEEMVYAGIDNEKYSKIFAAFLFASGILLVMKSV